MSSDDELYAETLRAHKDLWPLIDDAVVKSRDRLGDDDRLFKSHMIGHLTALFMNAVQIEVSSTIARTRGESDKLDAIDWDDVRDAFLELAGDCWDDWMRNWESE